jgi:hypothetical protein
MKNQDRIKKLKELNCQAKNMLTKEFDKLVTYYDYATFRELLNDAYSSKNDYYDLSVMFPQQQKYWDMRFKEAEKEFNKLLKQQNKILAKLTEINKQRRLLRINKVSKQLKIDF